MAGEEKPIECIVEIKSLSEDNNCNQNVNFQHSVFTENTEDYGPDEWLEDMLETRHDAKKEKVTTTSFLDPANWKRSTLTETEAIEKFNRRAYEPRFLNGRFKCFDCFSNFAREEKLKKHVLINHVESLGSQVCKFCKRRFSKPCKLRLHMKTHFVEIQCLRCQMVFCTEGLAFQHEEFHRGVVINCKYCKHEFKHKSTYYQHVRTHHRSRHVCSSCGASFCSEAGLNVHRKRLHQDKDEGLKEQTDSIYYYCKTCDIKFTSLKAYKEHYSHSTLHAEDVVELQKNRGLDSKKNPMMKVKCNVCMEMFYSYQACMKHHREHHPEVAFMKKFPTKPAVDKNVEKVNCDVCGVFIKATSLYTHMNAHTRTRMYQCDVCDMQFAYATSLLRHKVTHTGEKKYPCPACEKRFTQRNSMQLHYRTYHLKEPYPKRNRKKKDPLALNASHPNS